MVLPTFVINFLMSFGLGVLRSALDSTVANILGIFAPLVTTVVGLLVQAYMMGGITEVALRVARGEATNVGDVFSGGKHFGAFLVGHIVYSLLIAIGSLLCIVPGVIVALGTCLYGMLIVDRKLSGIDALKASWELTNGHKVQLLIFGVIAMLATAAGYIACFVGAVVASFPVIFVALAYVYLRLQGEQPKLPPAQGVG